MDARLRKRRGVLRVSASQHIDCSVRRRPFGPTPFLRQAGKLVSGSSRPVDAPTLRLGAPHLQQPHLQQPHLQQLHLQQLHLQQPYSQQLHSLRARQPSPSALAMRRAVCSVLARRAPSSRGAAYPRSPCLTLAHRGPSSPYPSPNGGKSLILKRVTENRAPCSQFRFRSVSKTATHRRVSAKQEIFRAAFAF